MQLTIHELIFYCNAALDTLVIFSFIDSFKDKVIFVTKNNVLGYKIYFGLLLFTLNFVLDLLRILVDTYSV